MIINWERRSLLWYWIRYSYELQKLWEKWLMTQFEFAYHFTLMTYFISSAVLRRTLPYVKANSIIKIWKKKKTKNFLYCNKISDDPMVTNVALHSPAQLNSHLHVTICHSVATPYPPHQHFPRLPWQKDQHQMLSPSGPSSSLHSINQIVDLSATKVLSLTGTPEFCIPGCKLMAWIVFDTIWRNPVLHPGMCAHIWLHLL